MKPYNITIGLAPTRRFIFSKEDALKYKKLIQDKLKELKINFVDIDDINQEGLLYSEDHIPQMIEKFKAYNIDALFFPHCNFGTEDLIGKLAGSFQLPILLWGPRDEAPLADGSRLRDTQCGLFATGKILRRFRLPFTYIPNCRLEDDAFERGVKNFVAAANVVKEFKNIRILQIATRPSDFWTMMCNEGELLERFGIQLRPITMSEFVHTVKLLQKNIKNADVQATIERMHQDLEVLVPDDDVRRLASVKVAMKQLADQYGCKAIAIQCWSALQMELAVMPCVANSLLTDDGIPVACETDIHGAITSIIAQAAGMGSTATFFADWSVRHPTNDNGELLQHCGPYPVSLMKTKAKLGRPFAFDDHCAGSLIGEIKGGEVTLLRFDGDGGEYSILLGKARSIEGPFTHGSYLWIEVDDWPKLEELIVKGPYVHHCVGIHGDMVPIIYEACQYLGLKIDFFDTNPERVKAFLRGGL